MRLLVVFTVAGMVWHSGVSAQQRDQALRTIRDLTSKEFAGRGYVRDGCAKAANYIRHKYDSAGLLSFTKGYAQSFSFPVNTFPGKMSVTLGGRLLQPGIDFIVKPNSGGACRKYRLTELKSYASPETFNEYPRVCYSLKPDQLPAPQLERLYVDLASGEIKSAALLIRQDKLTWGVAETHCAIPIIFLKEDSLYRDNGPVDICISQKQVSKFVAENLIGYVKGTAAPDSFLVFSAHYDHLGMMGSETFFPGANDNASGVAMLLALAAHFSKPENRPRYSIAFISFAGEEAGLVGSLYYTENPLFPLSRIRFLVNLDLLGTGDEGMTVVNATEYPGEFDLLDRLNEKYRYLPEIRQRGKAKNSDHYFFTENGVPSFFCYTLGGIQAYHDVFDKAETLPLTEFDDLFGLLVKFATSLQ